MILAVGVSPLQAEPASNVNSINILIQRMARA